LIVGTNNPFVLVWDNIDMVKSKAKSLAVAVIGIVSCLYLLNPGLGIFELIPDNLPIIGNLDEVTAAWLLLSALAYFGIDLRTFLIKRPGQKRIEP
jgi:hypothetical protein